MFSIFIHCMIPIYPDSVKEMAADENTLSKGIPAGYTWCADTFVIQQMV